MTFRFRSATRQLQALLCAAAALACAACSTPAQPGEEGDPVIAPDPPDAGPQVAPADECDNGIDDDENGLIDDGCPCRLGIRQSCYPGDPEDLDFGCQTGEQVCVELGNGELGWGACEGAVVPETEVCDGEDNDCNGTADDLDSGIPCEVELVLPGVDCVTLTCPAEQPFPVGCVDLNLQGGDSKGCVAHSGTNQSVFFKEGDSCGGSGNPITGTLICSQVPGPGLDATSCPMNKSRQFYPDARGGCPD